MAAVGQDLAVELFGQIAGGAAQRRGRRRQRQRGEGERDAGAQPVLAVRHFAHHRAQIADLHGERFQEGAVERKLGALQDNRGMLQPGDDALGGRRRAPRRCRKCWPPCMAIQSETSARALAAASSVPAARMWRSQRKPCSVFSQPRFGDLDLERRCAAGLDQMARKRKAAVIDFERDLRVGEAQVRRRDQHALRRASGIAPAIDRPGAQAPARLAPNLLGDERPETRRAAAAAKTLRAI